MMAKEKTTEQVKEAEGQRRWGAESKDDKKITLCFFWSISKIYMVTEIP
jgi:hypothetical protein